MAFPVVLAPVVAKIIRLNQGAKVKAEGATWETTVQEEETPGIVDLSPLFAPCFPGEGKIVFQADVARMFLRKQLDQ